MVGNTSHVSADQQVTAESREKDEMERQASKESQSQPQPRSLDGGAPEEHKGGFRGRMKDMRSKLKGTHLYDVKVEAIHMKHQVGKFQNLFNSNHRHDEEHEQQTDRKRTLIGESHRFQSFAPERDGNNIKWYVDGRDYFHAVSVALERAKETIYIEDWWLSPELFLRRPPAFNQEWRLDQVLKRAAERGVKIYVIVYKEVSAALTCNSAHSKHALEALCPEGTKGFGNIVVMRHPDHNFFENQGDMTFYWAHHEKFIVIDYDLAFIGGLDLCFGRWDNRQHTLADVHPSGVQNEIFPGQDFNNNRIMDFQTVEDWNSNELSKTEYGRMPWHDVSMGVIGPCVYDIAEHFILRWNFVKRDKYKRDDQYDWLLLEGRTGDMEDVISVQRPKHPVGDYITHPLSGLEGKRGDPGRGGRLTAKEQQARPGASRTSSSDDDFHDAAEDPHGYTDDQHRSASVWMDDHIPDFHRDKESPNPPPDAKRPGGSTEPGRQENYHMTGNKTENEGTVTASGGVAEKTKGYTSRIAGHGVSGGHGTVRGQIVRSSADWSSGILTESSIQNAYCQVIRNARHFVYIENQFFITATGDQQAPIHNMIGRAIVDACVRAYEDKRKFRVIIVIPAIPGFAGDLRSDAAAGTRAIMDYQYKSLCRGEHSIFGQIKKAGADPSQYVHVFNLRSYDRINATPRLMNELEESGVSYQELQRAQAEEIAGSSVHGAPGEGPQKPKKKERKDRLEDHIPRLKKDKAQPTESKGIFRRKVDQEVHESSESESDEEERMRKKYRSQQSAAEKKQRFQQHHHEQHDARLAEGDKGKSKVHSTDSIASGALLDDENPSAEYWAGRKAGENDSDDEAEDLRDTEKENFIQEELYIHAKLLIVDDRIAICGSSNINDRSQLGFHDSELSIVMEDAHSLPSKMNGKEYLAGHHAASLRRLLWREHLGLIHSQSMDAEKDPNAQPPGDAQNDYYAGDEWDEFVKDPMSDELWHMWTERATTNTKIFRHLFHADPDDHIKTFDDYDKFLPKQGHKAGHLFDIYQPVENVRKELDRVKGHLVNFPLKFLEDANMAEKGLQVNSWTESVYT